MGGFQSIAAVGRSLERFLNRALADSPPIEGESTRAQLVRTEDLEERPGVDGISVPGVTLLLYRVDFNKTMRAAWSSVGSQTGRFNLPLDLHFLLTPWGENAEDEYQILGHAMAALERSPIFSGPLLHPSGEWTAGEALQVCLDELSTENLMRTFDSLPINYKLSIPYLVRIVRLEGADRSARPVTSVVTGATPNPDEPLK